MGDRGSVAPLVPGERFDSRWEILGPLGSGSTAQVVAARHDYGLEAALKVLHPHLAEDEGARRAFIAQGYLTNHLSHPGLVRVLDEGEGPYGPYLVMERVDGEALDSRLSRHARLPTTQALDIACSLLEILDHLHAAGLFHRRLAPREILVERKGTVRLIDFDGACGLDGYTHARLSLTPVSSRPDSYAPPGASSENGGARTFPHTDLRKDLWAAAAILYRMLTGGAPWTFDAGSPPRLARTGPPLSSARPDLPATFSEVVEQALDASGGSLFDSAGHLRRSLIEAWTFSRARRSG